jgi:hypothetical protein
LGFRFWVFWYWFWFWVVVVELGCRVHGLGFRVDGFCSSGFGVRPTCDPTVMAVLASASASPFRSLSTCVTVSFPFWALG